MNTVMITKNKTALSLIVIGVIGLVWYLSAHKKLKTDSLNPAVIVNPVITVSSSSNPLPPSTNSPSAKPSGKNLQSLTPQEAENLLGGGYKTVPYSQLTKPAVCSIGGSMNFLTHDTAVNYNPKISYTGVDSPARQIKWKVTPVDDLKVGPNLDAALELPDGESPVSVILPSSPVSKNYNLTVSMTYGRLVGEGVKVYEVSCSGQIGVTLSY